MKNVIFLALAVFTLSACSSDGGKRSTGDDRPDSKGASSSSSSSSGTNTPDPISVIVNGEKTLKGSSTDELFQNFQRLIFPVEEFDTLYRQADTAGLNTDAVDDIQDATVRAITAITMVFGKDVSGGELELTNNTGVDVERKFTPGDKGKGNTYQYIVDQEVYGITVDIDMTFKFLGSGAQFTPGADSMEVTFNPMKVGIEAFRVGVDNVWLNIEKVNPMATMAFGARLAEASTGEYVSAEIWPAFDGSPLLRANIIGWLRDSASGVNLKLTVDGQLTSLSGNINLKNEIGEQSEVLLKSDKFTVSLEAEGLSQPVFSSSSSSSNSSSSASSSSSSSSGGIDSFEVKLEGKNDPLTSDPMLGLLTELTNIVDPDKVEELFLTAKKEGMRTPKAKKVYSALQLAAEAIGVSLVTDVAGRQIELENATEIDVVSSLGAGDKGKTYNYVIDDVVTLPDSEGDVEVEIDITFLFPGNAASFAPYQPTDDEEGGMFVTFPKMEVNVQTIRAGINGVWLTVEPTNPILSFALVAQLVGNYGDFKVAYVWSEDGLFFDVNVHGALKDRDYSITFDVTGEADEAEGTVYLKDSNTEDSSLEFNAIDIEASMNFLK